MTPTVHARKPKGQFPEARAGQFEAQKGDGASKRLTRLPTSYHRSGFRAFMLSDWSRMDYDPPAAGGRIHTREFFWQKDFSGKCRRDFQNGAGVGPARSSQLSPAIITSGAGFLQTLWRLDDWMGLLNVCSRPGCGGRARCDFGCIARQVSSGPLEFGHHRAQSATQAEAQAFFSSLS